MPTLTIIKDGKAREGSAPEIEFKKGDVAGVSNALAEILYEKKLARRESNHEVD